MSSTLARRHASDVATAVLSDAARAAGAARGEAVAVSKRAPWELPDVQLAVVAGEGLLITGTSVQHWTGRVGGRGFGPGATPPGVGISNGAVAPQPTPGQTLETLSVPSSVEGATLWRDGATPVMYAPGEVFIALAFSTLPEAAVTGPEGVMPTEGAVLFSVPGVIDVGLWNGPKLYARVIQASGTAVLVGGHVIGGDGFDGFLERVYVVELALVDGELTLSVDGVEYAAPCGDLFATGGPKLVLGGGVGGAGWELPIAMATICSAVPSAQERLEFRAWCRATLGDAPGWVAPSERVETDASGFTIPWSSFTFARATEASYLTDAPGTGGSPFMSWAAAGALREEDRGDGAGPLPLLEGARTNQVVRSQEIDSGSWTTAGTVTVTAGQDSPDSGTTAERLQCASGVNIRYQNLTPGSGYRSLSAWVRAAGGTVDHYVYVYDGSAVYYAGQSGISTTYRRLSVTRSLAAGAGNVGAADGRVGGIISAGARDAYIAHVQLEAGKFPTSAIRTTSGAATRSADEATMTASVPGALFTARGRFAECSPVFASTDLTSGDVAWLLSIGGSSNGIRIYHDGTDCYVQALEGGVVVAESQPLGWAAHDLIGAVGWDPAAGLVYVDGIAGPAGTPWSWTSGPIRVGGIYGSSGSEAFARLGALGSW